MPASSDPLQLRVKATPEVVAGVRRTVASYARELGCVSEVSDLELAISEVVTNAVLHAYPDPPPGEVEVIATPEPDNGLKVTVTDNGLGMRPRPDSPGLGLGLPTIVALTASTSVAAAPGGGTELCMAFVKPPVS